MDKAQNEKMKNKIKEILLDEFSSVYCDTCAFNYLSEKESEEKYGYWGCDMCHRKYMNWSLHNNCADDLADYIVETMNDYNK